MTNPARYFLAFIHFAGVIDLAADVERPQREVESARQVYFLFGLDLVAFHPIDQMFDRLLDYRTGAAGCHPVQAGLLYFPVYHMR